MGVVNLSRLRDWDSTCGENWLKWRISDESKNSVGPPASGKSTYVTDKRGKNDITYDYDILMQSLGGVEPHQHNKAIGKYLWQIRQLLIKNLSDDKELDTFWCIVTWVDDAFKDFFKDYDEVEYILMDTSEKDCIARIESNDDRQATKDEQIQVVKDWFKKYKENQTRKRIALLAQM